MKNHRDREVWAEEVWAEEVWAEEVWAEVGFSLIFLDYLEK